MSGLMDVFGGDGEPNTPAKEPVQPAQPKATQPSSFGSDLPGDVTRAVAVAAAAVDAEAAIKATLDAQKEELNAVMSRKLAPLNEQWKAANAVRKEAEEVLLLAMQAEKISRVPMQDRPEIKIKVVKGRKKSITRKWLHDPENVVVKTYGPEAAATIWDSVPTSDSRTEIVIPPPYEDEPSG